MEGVGGFVVVAAVLEVVVVLEDVVRVGAGVVVGVVAGVGAGVVVVAAFLCKMLHDAVSYLSVQ